MTEREEMLALALQDWLNYAEDNLSEFDLEECFAGAETTLCPRCQISGCINLKIRTARSALSAFKDSAQDSALRSAARTGHDVQPAAWQYRDHHWSDDRWHVCAERPNEIKGRTIRALYAALPAPAGEGVTVGYQTAAFQNTDDADPMLVLDAVRHCASSWEGSVRLLGNVRAKDIVRAIATITRKSEARS